MSKIFTELSIVLVSFRSRKKIKQIISKIDKKFKIFVVENSNDKDLENKINKRKNIFF